jgi:hypothetical protein
MTVKQSNGSSVDNQLSHYRTVSTRSSSAQCSRLSKADRVSADYDSVPKLRVDVPTNGTLGVDVPSVSTPSDLDRAFPVVTYSNGDNGVITDVSRVDEVPAAAVDRDASCGSSTGSVSVESDNGKLGHTDVTENIEEVTTDEVIEQQHQGKVCCGHDSESTTNISSSTRSCSSRGSKCDIKLKISSCDEAEDDEQEVNGDQTCDVITATTTDNYSDDDDVVVDNEDLISSESPASSSTDVAADDEEQYDVVRRPGNNSTSSSCRHSPHRNNGSSSPALTSHYVTTVLPPVLPASTHDDINCSSSTLKFSSAGNAVVDQEPEKVLTSLANRRLHTSNGSSLLNVVVKDWSDQNISNSNHTSSPTARCSTSYSQTTPRLVLRRSPRVVDLLSPCSPAHHHHQSSRSAPNEVGLFFGDVAEAQSALTAVRRLTARLGLTVDDQLDKTASDFIDDSVSEYRKECVDRWRRLRQSTDVTEEVQQQQNIGQTLLNIATDLVEVSTMDEMLARQLLTLSCRIQQLKLYRQCCQHRDLLDSVVESDDKRDELSVVLPFVDVLPDQFDRQLKHRGLTRSHLRADERRRFTIF